MNYASSVIYDQRQPAVPPNNPGFQPAQQQPQAKDPDIKQEATEMLTTSSSSTLGFVPIPFHNPFDISSYPITNPPIFDSTMNLPYDIHDGHQKRRRISISNGQIGQIINHEAIFDYEQGLLGYNLPKVTTPAHGQSQQTAVATGQPAPYTYKGFTPADVLAMPQFAQPFHPQYQGQVGNDSAVSSAPVAGVVAPPASVRTAAAPVAASVTSSTTPAHGTAAAANPQSADAAGVPPPNHQLLYNDEVIFNPNNGPIPGTAAWKKERLLERNRIAASKCRQRKKQAQLELQNNVSKIEKKMLDEKTRAEELELQLAGVYDSLRQYFDTQDPSHLERYRLLVSK